MIYTVVRQAYPNQVILVQSQLPSEIEVSETTHAVIFKELPMEKKFADIRNKIETLNIVFGMFKVTLNSWLPL